MSDARFNLLKDMVHLAPLMSSLRIRRDNEKVTHPPENHENSNYIAFKEFIRNIKSILSAIIVSFFNNFSENGLTGATYAQACRGVPRVATCNDHGCRFILSQEGRRRTSFDP